MEWRDFVSTQNQLTGYEFRVPTQTAIQEKARLNILFTVNEEDHSESASSRRPNVMSMSHKIIWQA